MQWVQLYKRNRISLLPFLFVLPVPYTLLLVLLIVDGLLSLLVPLSNLLPLFPPVFFLPPLLVLGDPLLESPDASESNESEYLYEDPEGVLVRADGDLLLESIVSFDKWSFGLDKAESDE